MAYVMTTTDKEGNKVYLNAGYWKRDFKEAEIFPEIFDFIPESLYGTAIELEVLDIDTAHAEALKMNDKFDTLLEAHFSNEIGRTYLLNDRQINFVLNVTTPVQYSPAQGDL